MATDKFKASLAAALPRHLTADRFVRVVLNATMRDPKLLQCTQDSFFQCCLELAAIGLEPDGRNAHLIPRKKTIKTPGKRDYQILECTKIVDYKGLAVLVRRSGEVSYIHADVVYEGDEFSFAYGTEAHLKHKPKLDARPANAKRIAFYSYVRLLDGSEDFMVYSPAKVEEVRQRSPAKDSGPWKTDYDAMGMKTVFRPHTKWLPFSSELKDKIEHDDEYTDGPTIDITDSFGMIGLVDQAAQADAIKAQKLADLEGASETINTTQAEETEKIFEKLPTDGVHGEVVKLKTKDGVKEYQYEAGSQQWYPVETDGAPQEAADTKAPDQKQMFDESAKGGKRPI